MIPREPPRCPQLGFLYAPPYRIQGLSIAGEQSAVQVPELDLCFDIGLCPRPVLSSNYVALTHGHMDHAAGIAYYFSQRHFQGMGTGTCVCHPALERPLQNVMNAWVEVESQRTPHYILALPPDAEIEVKNNLYLRAFETLHTVPSNGYVVIERRNKLRPEFTDRTQEQLMQLKASGTEITHVLEIPLICYTGDTMWGKHFDRPDVLAARVLITECTFLEAGHRDRANVGKHLHLDHIVRLLERSSADAIILTHLSRRTHLNEARQAIDKAIRPEDRERVLVLMDSRSNRQRYEMQLAEAQRLEQQKGT